MGNHLLIPATAELLDGWVGPVMWGSVPSVYSCQGHFLAYRHGGHLDAFDLNRWAEIGDLALDLSRAECRDRVSRCLTARWVQAHRAVSRAGGEDAWLDRREDGSVGVWLCGPRIDQLNPNDAVRLADGSRESDALALAIAWREANRG